MAKQNTKAPPVLTVNGVEYKHEDLNDEQKIIYAHISDLQRKANTTRFNLDQLKVGQEAFGNMLVESLKKGKDEETEENDKK